MCLLLKLWCEYDRWRRGRHNREGVTDPHILDFGEGIMIKLLSLVLSVYLEVTASSY
jgi:hypothetical protein